MVFGLIYTRDESTMGETTRGSKLLGRGETYWEETTRGGNSLGAKRHKFTATPKKYNALVICNHSPPDPEDGLGIELCFFHCSHSAMEIPGVCII